MRRFNLRHIRARFATVLTAALLLANVTGMPWAREALAITVLTSEAPTNNLDLTIGAIRSARRMLQINIYEMTSPEIADALVAQVRAGITVQVLEEGQPFGQSSAAQKVIRTRLVEEMVNSGVAGDRFYEMTSEAGGKRRYRYDHGKYIVVDGQALLIGSENYSPSGNPVPGTLGNRGWEVLIQDAGVASQFQKIFAQDTDLAPGDVEELVSQERASRKPPSRKNPSPPVTGDLSKIPALNADQVVVITSPETSVSGVVQALNAARSTVDIEQMTFDSQWAKAPQSPILDAVLAAARRGVQVRVLLNDESVFDKSNNGGQQVQSRPKNADTVRLLNDAASREHLKVSARIANVKAMGVDYIHNKGLLIDGNQTLISSINWNENSFQHNRETAVLITSRDVNAHYQALFNADWAASANQN